MEREEKGMGGREKGQRGSKRNEAFLFSCRRGGQSCCWLATLNFSFFFFFSVLSKPHLVTVPRSPNVRFLFHTKEIGEALHTRQLFSILKVFVYSTSYTLITIVLQMLKQLFMPVWQYSLKKHTHTQIK